MNWKLFRFTLKRHLVVLRLLIKNNGAERGALLQKTGEFAHIEKNFWHEPVKFPAEPQLVSVGDNVNIASDVAIVYHDIIPFMINNMEGEKIVTIRWGKTIENNVFVGSRSLILYDVTIGNNVIIGAGSVVTKDIPDGSVVAGIPARVIGRFEDSVEKYKENNRIKRV